MIGMNFSENVKKKGIKVYNKDFNAEDVTAFIEALVTEARAFVPLKKELPPINEVDKDGNVTVAPKTDL